MQIENLTKAFGPKCVLRDVSFVVDPGELFFLLGPSGCGKTTLLRCIAGFHAPDRGVVRVAGKDITSLAPHLRDTGMVFQSYALWPHMTVRENVAFGLETRRVGRRQIQERVADALSLVRMAERAEARPNQLSGGEQQRIALARALVVEPQCLLLDEPLSNLDAKLRLEMRTEIRRICKEAGLTAVYVTHDQKEALSIADRIVIMNEGRIEQIGTPLDVYRRPVSRFVADFVGETNFLEGTVIAGDSGVRVLTDVGDLVSSCASSGPFAVGQRVTVSIRPEAIRFGDSPGTGANMLRGQLHSSLYLGEIAQHQLHLSARGSGGDNGVVCVRACELNPAIVAGGREDGVLRVWVDPADVVVLVR